MLRRQGVLNHTETFLTTQREIRRWTRLAEENASFPEAEAEETPSEETSEMTVEPVPIGFDSIALTSPRSSPTSLNEILSVQSFFQSKERERERDRKEEIKHHLLTLDRELNRASSRIKTIVEILDS